MLPANVIEVADGFWNIRGSFKIAGLLDIGTQASLVRLASGKYVLLDTCSLSGETGRWLDDAVDGGSKLEAILNLHPFHTVFVRRIHDRYPDAKLYGTSRHQTKQSALPWQDVPTEDPAFNEMFADDFDFSVPRGVDFVPSDENLHFASVLAFHRASRTLHVDDTVTYVRLPKPLRLITPELTRLHPTLGKVLQPRPGAAAEFRAWAGELIERSGTVENLCAAHTATLLARANRGASVAKRIERAVEKVEPKLRAHERAHG